MSGFKKLRLDPELHKSLSNQPGACSSDSFGRGYVDSSSFSSSTSGGNGSSSAIRRSTGGPFRTRYSQPGGGASSFSRFSPYYFGKERRQSLKVPLIRARRDDSDSERPSSRASLNSSIGGDSTTSVTSSTAQRIIETLQNLSTPVINAGKIRIDQDIKAVQPFFGASGAHFRTSPGASFNRSTGPPKICSSLLMSNPSPANQISPITDQRRLFCIPKMVDAATNTDKDADSNQTSPQQIRTGSTKSLAFSSSTGTSAKSIKYPASKADKESDDEEFQDCSDFAFSSAWSPDRFSGYFTVEKGTKPGNAREGLTAVTSQQPMLLNGYKEDAPLSSVSEFSGSKVSGASVNFKSSNSTSQNVSGLKPAGSGGFEFGGSTSQDTSKRGNEFTSSTVDTSKHQNAMTGLNFRSSNDNKPSFGSKVSANFSGSSSPSGLIMSTKSSSEPERRQKRKYSLDAEDESDTPFKPLRPSFGLDAPANKISTSISSSSTAVSQSTPVLPPLTVKSSGSKWRCPVCMIENQLDAPQCVACTAKNPNNASKPAISALPPLSAIASSQSKSKWRCPTCMADNELEAAACVCCTEKNPNAKAVSAPTSVKKWRCLTCMVDNDPAVSACVCCAEKNPNPVSSGLDRKDSTLAPQPAFKFGLSGSTGSSSATSSPSASTFSFGAKPTSDTSSTPANFSFGVSTPTTASSTSASVPISQPSASFKFGATNSSTSAPSTTSIAATPVTQSILSGPSGSPASFGFGASSATSTSAIVSSSQTSTATTPFSFGTSSSPAPSSVTSASETVPVAAVTQASITTGSSGFKFGMNSPMNSFPSTQSTATPSFSFGSSAPVPSQASSNTTTTTATASPFGKPAISDSGSDQGKPATVFGSSNFSGGTGGNFSFGNSANTASDSQKPSFGFAAASPPKQPFSTFSFGNGGQPSSTPASITSPPTTLPSAAPTPSLNAPPSFNFSSGSASLSTPFGQPASSPAPPTQLFQFGASTPAATPVMSAPAPSFSLTPNLNFGAATPGSSIPFGNPTQPTLNAGSQPPQNLFQFNASSPTTADRSGRTIKKAVRRTMRR